MLSEIKKRTNNNQDGFTIIEVLIVLAIAGLIMLIVFLAVPALQRSSHNTTAKNDASAVAAGLSEYISNNDGASATSAATGAVAGVVNITGAGTAAAAKVNGSTVVTTVTTAPAAAVNSITTSQIQVLFGKNCGATITSARAAAVYYGAESPAGTATKCIDA